MLEKVEDSRERVLSEPPNVSTYLVEKSRSLIDVGIYTKAGSNYFWARLGIRGICRSIGFILMTIRIVKKNIFHS